MTALEKNEQMSEGEWKIEGVEEGRTNGHKL